jgi:hypothetical protein
LELGRGDWIGELICGSERFSVWGMTSKQLANVALKILGLSMCLYSIPSVFYQIVMAFDPFPSLVGSSDVQQSFRHHQFSIAVILAARESISVIIGLFIIIKSRKMAEWLFKNEAE